MTRMWWLGLSKINLCSDLHEISFRQYGRSAFQKKSIFAFNKL